MVVNDDQGLIVQYKSKMNSQELRDFLLYLYNLMHVIGDSKYIKKTKECPLSQHWSLMGWKNRHRI